MLRRVISLILCLIMLVSAVPVSVFAEETTEVSEHQHVWDDGVATEPNCVTAGCTTYTCATCGESYSDSEVPALGHSWGDWTVTAEPTAEAEGERERICSVCFAEETETIEKLSQPEPVAVTSVAVSQEKDYVEVLVTDTLQLTATVLPENATDKTVTWSSSDNAIATVDEAGLVTGIAAGTVTITAACGEVQGTYALTVVLPGNITLEEVPETDTSGSCGENLTWEFDETTGTLTISGSGAMEDYDPHAAPWDGYCPSITNVVLEGGITSIGCYAFLNCSKLTSVTIPEGVTSISSSAFSSCHSLKEATIPVSVTTIGGWAFEYCTSLTKVFYSGSKEQWKVISIGTGNDYLKNAVIELAPGLYFGRYNDSLTWELNSTAGTLTISGSGAMEDYVVAPWKDYRDSITKVVLEEGVMTIGASAFDELVNLTTVTIPESVTRIGGYAFDGCTSLTSVTIPETVNEYGLAVFGYESSFMPSYEGTVQQWFAIGGNGPVGCIDGTITYAGNVHAGVSTDVNWSYLDGTLYIHGSGSMPKFQYNPYSWTQTGWEALKNQITKIVVMDGVTSISGFRDLTALTSVELPESVTQIDDYTFMKSTGLRRIVISKQIAEIGAYAFYDCTNLTQITFTHESTDTLTISSEAFAFSVSGTTLVNTTVVVPSIRDIHTVISESLEGTAGRTVIWKSSAENPITAIELAVDGGTTLVELGLPVSLTASVTPETATDALCWTVSDPEMGELQIDGDSAVFFGKKEGKVTVRCASAEDETLYEEAELTILPPTAELTGISIRAAGTNPYEIDLSQPTQMVVGFEPGNASARDVTWELDEGTGSATIDENGLVTAMSPGTVVITVTSVQNPSISATQSMEILRYVEDLTILLNGEENVTKIGVGETMTLSVLVAPVDAKFQTEDIKWSLTNGTGNAKLYANAMYNDTLPCIEGISAGTVTLTATSPDSCACAVSVELEVTGEKASYAVTGGNIYYNTETGIITGSDSTVTDVTIPAKIGDTTITGIAPYAFANRNFYYQDNFYFVDNTALTSVKLPDTVTYIGDHAFEQCTKLSVLKLGNGVTTIGERAFRGCKSITNLNIPDSVSSIGSEAFYDLNGLKYLTLSGEWDPRDWLSVSYSNPLETVTFTGSMVIGSAYSQNYGYYLPGRDAKKVIISDTVTSIGDYAFLQCDAITSVTVGSNVQTIGNYAFVDCNSLTSVILPEGLTSIGNNAFEFCGSLTSLNLPDSLTYIGKDCFSGCNQLQLIDLSAIPDVIMVKETNLTNKAIVPAVLVSATGGKASLYWSTYLNGESEGEILNAWEIADVYSWDNMKNWVLEARSTGKVILECHDEYTGARGSKEISIETGIEVRGIPEYLISGKYVTLTSYRMPDNIQESVTWSLREEDKAYASLSTSYGETTKLTAKAVDRAVEIVLTATPNNSGMDESVTKIWILPKATGITITEENSTVPVTTMSLDMHLSSTLNLATQIQPAGALETVTWKSSDTKIATVVDGVVTLKKPGTVTISATTQDSSNKSASVKLAVTYLDSASKLTAKADIPSIGLQNTSSSTMLVYGADREVPLNTDDLVFSIPESQQQIATVDENGVITAGSKPGTVTVTAAIAGDPLNRKVSLNVKVIALQTQILRLTPEKKEPAELIMLDANGDVTEDEAEAVKYWVYLDKDHVQSGTYQFQIVPSAVNTRNEVMTLTNSSLKWSSTDTRVATVAANADGSATVTVKAKTNGACAISAVTTDLAKTESELTIYVRDYAPRLETTSLILNTYRVSGITTDLLPSYGVDITEVSVHEYDSKSKTYLEEPSTRLTASYADGQLTIQHEEYIKNSTIKLQLRVACDNGETYTYNLTVKVANSLPAITVKQGAKFNLFYKDSEAVLNITAKNLTIDEVALDQSSTASFQTVSYDKETGALTVGFTEAYLDGDAKLDAKVNLLVYLEGYNVPITKAVTIATVTTKPSLSLTPASSIINTKLETDHSTSFRIYNKTANTYVPAEAVEVTAAFAETTLNGDTVKLTLTEMEGVTNMGGTASVMVQEENWTSAIELSHKVTVQDSLPTASISSSTLKLNRVFFAQPVTATVALNQSNLTIAAVEVESADTKADARAEAAKIDFSYEKGVLTASIPDGENAPKNGTYTFRYVVTLDNEAGTKLAAKTFKVNVHSTVPGVKAAIGTLKLNRYLGTNASAETEVTLTNGTGYELTALNLPEGWSSSDFEIRYAEGRLTVTLLNSEAGLKSHTVTLKPELTHTATGQTVTLTTGVTVKVQIYNAMPSVSISAKGKLDTMDPNSAITYTVNKFSNVSGEIEGVELIGEGSELFEVTLDTSGSKPVVQLTQKEGAQYATNKTYKLQMVFTICGREVGANISFKVSQSALKFGTVPALKLYQFQRTPMTCTVTLTAPAGAALEEISLSSKTAVQFLRAMAGGEMKVEYSENRQSATVSFEVRNPGYLTYGKSYTVYLDITPENNASNVNPTQVKLTVNTYK